MAQEVIRGTAAGVRYTVSVSGGKDGVSTDHHALFKLGQTTVMFSSGAPPVIGEGDRLIVAGRMKGNVLLADAYLNETARVRGDAGMWTNFAGMLGLFLLAAVGFGWVLLEPFVPALPRMDGMLRWFVGAAAALLLCVGIHCLYKWLRIRSAVQLVMGR